VTITASSAPIACWSSLSLRSHAGCQALVCFASQMMVPQQCPEGECTCCRRSAPFMPLGDGHDLVEREGVAQQRFEGQLERFALELLRAPARACA